MIWDRSGNLVDPLATGFSHLVHHGRSHSHSLGHRCRGDSGQSHSRPEGIVATLDTSGRPWGSARAGTATCDV